MDIWLALCTTIQNILCVIFFLYMVSLYFLDRKAARSSFFWTAALLFLGDGVAGAWEMSAFFLGDEGTVGCIIIFA